jgi:hypothetical protein
MAELGGGKPEHNKLNRQNVHPLFPEARFRLRLKNSE